jgi:antitoxin component of MazEF toxin-antitoxin module
MVVSRGDGGCNIAHGLTEDVNFVTRRRPTWTHADQYPRTTPANAVSESEWGAKNLIFVSVGLSLHRAERERVAYARTVTATPSSVLGPDQQTRRLVSSPPPPPRKHYHSHCGQHTNGGFVIGIRIPSSLLRQLQAVE